jgi:hypothetical protein
MAGLVLAASLFAAGAATAADPTAPTALPGPGAPGLLRLADADSELKRESLYQCCQRFIHGQSLIGFYCSRKHLDQGLRRKQVKIIALPGGRQACVPGYGV